MAGRAKTPGGWVCKILSIRRLKENSIDKNGAYKSVALEGRLVSSTKYIFISVSGG